MDRKRLSKSIPEILKANSDQTSLLRVIKGTDTPRRGDKAEVSDGGLFNGLEEMLSLLIHNSKNQLAPIKGYASLIQDDNDGQDNSKRWADKIVRNVRRMEDHLELLNMYRIRSAVGMGNTSWQHTVAAVMDYFSAINVKAIPIEIVNDTRGSFEQHGELLKRVLMHLVINAYESIGATGKMTLTVAELDRGAGEKRRFAVHVSDTGCGIEPENIESAWTPFYTTKHDHIGLGLPYVAAAASILGMNIEVESSAGRGTTVGLVLAEQGG